MEAGELSAMSFAFWVVRQMWSPDYEQRDILEVDIDGGDTSVVTWPANPWTEGTTALRKRAAASLARSRVPRLLVERARTEKRAGAKLSAATLDSLQEVLDLIAEADVAVDAAQELLSELMGVPNPDDERRPHRPRRVMPAASPTRRPTPGPARTPSASCRPRRSSQLVGSKHGCSTPAAHAGRRTLAHHLGGFHLPRHSK
jgi:hypothetical protein